MLNTNLDLDTETSGGSFLGDLGPPIRRYPYKGVRQFLDTLEMELRRQEEEFDVSEWVLFANVNQQTFSRDFLNSDNEILQRCWNSYDSLENLILVNMSASRPHEVATRQFERHFLKSLEPMRLDNAVQTFGSATCVAPDGSAKQPDCQYLPRKLPRGRGKKWPSVVVESGFSESPSKFMSDARYWLTRSNREVQTVFTIRIGRSNPEIIIESWKLVDDRVKRQQQIKVHKGENKHIYVWGHSLILGFSDVFLRPASLARETDIRFDDHILKEFAEMVWDEQEF
ncbi:hypothetical protein N7491_005204 [Penicillium cf. griseofulvum]|uniref:Uncharacterized protein n=1 Tax=Penicillium cf. griseofulvum TaxID=2972120 RepID=A0A9W9J2R8_9EURO|nr:hypothetical protein N7472_007897 [Penicillium cf. griseofulvum]KAJ5434609.1 hypothetical protein N7491_005204 [Penicillium cf. griseofulvum]KAJ5452438.1 hypothetical protein N7445_000621 [Penicillium cf. griseofulvum]